MAADRVCAMVEIHCGAGIVARVERESHLSLKILHLLCREVNRLFGTEERNEPLHHVHLDMAVDKEVAAQMVLLRALVRPMAVLEAWMQKHRWRLGFDDK